MSEREKVAKAIYYEMNSIMHDHEQLWAECGKQELYRDCARAALLTMHKPTPPAMGAVTGEEIMEVMILLMEKADSYQDSWTMRRARSLLARLKDAP